MVLLDTGTAGTSREIYSEDADDGTRTGNLLVVNLGTSRDICSEDADDGTRTRNPSVVN